MNLALDLFCGAGGAALGLIEAGFEVVGVDTEARHARVYPGRFVCGDAINPPVDIRDFDFVWASPPCQRFAVGTKRTLRSGHPNLIPETRRLLNEHPFTVIENVPPAPIRADLVLTGPMVGLSRIERRRHFELSYWPGLIPSLRHVPRAMWEAGEAISVTTSLCASAHFYPRKRAGKRGRVSPAEACEAMGITIPMTGRQVGEAVPPAYAEFIGRAALAAIGTRAAA